MININNFIFTTILVYNNKALALAKHLKKLELDYKNYFNSQLDLKRLTLPLVDNNQGYSRLNIYTYQSGEIKTKISPYARSLESVSLQQIIEPFASQCRFKIDPKDKLNKLKEIQTLGYDDGIFVDENHIILETSFCNLFWIRGNTLYTPSCDLNLYFGVTIGLVIEYAKNLNYKIKQVKEKDFLNLHHSHVFICNSMKGIVCVERIDQKKLEVNQKFADNFNHYYLSDNFSAQESKSFSSISSF